MVTVTFHARYVGYGFLVFILFYLAGGIAIGIFFNVSILQFIAEGGTPYIEPTVNSTWGISFLFSFWAGVVMGIAVTLMQMFEGED